MEDHQEEEEEEEEDGSSDKERKYIINYVEERGIVILIIIDWAFSTVRRISRKTWLRTCWRVFPAPKTDDKSV